MYKTSELIINYIIFKTQNGYNPYFSLGEIKNLIDFMSTNIELDINPENLDEYIINLIKENKKTIWNGKSQLIYNDGKVSMRYNMLVDKNFSKIDTKEKLLYFELMKQFLKDFKLRTVDVVETYPKNSELASTILTDLIMRDYINHYIDKNIWPETLSDPFDYILKQDLSSAFNIPSIKQDVIIFHRMAKEKIACLLNEDRDLKISNKPNYCLKKANFDFIIKDFSDLKKYCSTEFDIDFQEQIYTIFKKPVGISDYLNSDRVKTLDQQLKKRL